MFSKLFEKLKINNLELSNRLIMSAMSTQMAKNGFVTPEIMKFYELRTKNSAGLILIGGASVHPSGNFGMFEIEIFDDKYIPGLTKLTEMIHKNNTKAALQLNHAGKLAHPLFIKQTPISSSSLSVESNSVRSKSSPQPIAMPRDLIDMIIRSFVESAVRAKKSGFDAVEIHAGNGFLIDQFLSPAVNKRTDQYGGKLINRMRFLLEIIDGIKSKLPGFPIIVKINGHDLLKNGNTIEDHIEIANNLEKCGINAVEIAPGSYESRINNIIMYIPRGNHYYISKKIKEHLVIPVFISERFGFYKNIYECLLNDYADGISMARSLICDPLMIEKLKSNKSSEIRECISCNQGCYEPLLEMKNSTCIQNPYILGDKNRKPIKSKKKIVIIGAGPSGLEACIRLKKLGFDVSIYEKRNIICSKVRYASIIPGQSDFLSIITNYENMLKKYKIKIHYNWDENIDSIINEQPHGIIAATGSLPKIPDIEGIEYSVTAEDILDEKKLLGEKIIIIGAGALGCEMAIYSAKTGAMNHEQFYFNLRHGILTLDQALNAALKNNRNITMLGMKKLIGADLPRSRKITLLEELDQCGINIQSNCQVEKILKSSKNKYSVFCKIKERDINKKIIYKEEILEADTIINAAGYKPSGHLYEKLYELFPDKIYKIGDAEKAGSLKEAIKDGYDIANYIYDTSD